MYDLLTWQEYRSIGLAEQHAEVDVAQTIISESYTATARRLGIPPIIDTGKFRPKKGDPITIRVDKVINQHPWEQYRKTYLPQYDHSFLSRAFLRVHPGYCDFLTRFYTSRFRTPAPQVYLYLSVLTQLTSAEKIMEEKWLAGPQAFAYPGVYELMNQCYQIRREYAEKHKAVNSLAKRYAWGVVRKEAERLLLRREYRVRSEQLRTLAQGITLEALPQGYSRILLLPVEGSTTHD